MSKREIILALTKLSMSQVALTWSLCGRVIGGICMYKEISI